MFRLLAEAGPSPQLLLGEPALAEFGEHIKDLIARLQAGDAIEECLESWVGDKSGFAGLAARYGCLNEWLLDTAAWLENRSTRSHYRKTCLNTFMQASIPLGESLPLVAESMDNADSAEVARRLSDGQTLAQVATYMGNYSEPLLTWLDHSERCGNVAVYHDYLVRQILDKGLVWPLQSGQTLTYQVRSMLLLVDVGLSAGRSLDQIVNDIPDEIEAAPWWSEVLSAYADSASFARAMVSRELITALAAQIIGEAEHAGQLGPTLLHVVANFDRGLLYPLATVTRYKRPSADANNEAGKDQADSSFGPDAVEAWIDTISIRGRMAYALLCIESALVEWPVYSADLRSALAVFWEFTSSGRLDVWETESQRAQPFLYTSHDDSKRDWAEMAEYFGYSELPPARQEALGCMLVRLHGISENLYAGFDSAVTAGPLIEIINVMQTVGLTLPDCSRVSLSSVEEDGGWGRPHPRHFFL